LSNKTRILGKIASFLEMFRKFRRNRHRTLIAFLAVTIASGAVGAGLLTLAPGATFSSASLIARTLSLGSDKTVTSGLPDTGDSGSGKADGQTLISALTSAGKKFFSAATWNRRAPSGPGNAIGAHPGTIANHSPGTGNVAQPNGAGAQSGSETNVDSVGTTPDGGTSALGSGSTGGGKAPTTIPSDSSILAPLADRSWTGGFSTTWGNGLNWSGGVVPGAGDNAVFNGTFTFGRQPNLTASATVGCLWMTTGVGQNVTVSASAGTLTLAGNTINGIANLGILVDNTNAFTLTITAPLQLGNPQTWLNNSANLLTISGAGILNTNGNSLTIGGSGDTSISRVISGTGSLIKSGAGTLTLSGANTYTGSTTFGGGTISIAGNASNLGTPPPTFTPNSLIFSGGRLLGTGTFSLSENRGSTLIAATTSNISATSGNTVTVLGVIAGSGNITYGTASTGTGTIVVSAANTYTGTTTVNAGTLLINGNQSAATGAVTVNNSGTTLGGTGTIGGTVTVNAGANIAPGSGGNTTAILNTGALTLASTSNFRVDINGLTAGTGYDRLNVTGTVSIGGSNLMVTVGTSLNIGQTFLIVNNDLADAVSGIFAQGGTVFSGPYAFSINYTGGDGNDILLTVTAVPEPSTWICGALALVALVYTQRRMVLKKLRVLS
jgi:fibronectin-binding autotransporter adhesin